jgi:hypothetical protein
LSRLFKDGNGGATADLYYDTTGSGFAGTAIATGLNAVNGEMSYNWNVGALPDGLYYVYARFRNGEFSDAVYGGSVRKLTDMEAYSAADNIPSSDPEVALFLAITTQAINAKRALEIGGTLPVNSSAAPESSRAPNLCRPKLSMPCHGLAARSIWLTLTR